MNFMMDSTFLSSIGLLTNMNGKISSTYPNHKIWAVTPSFPNLVNKVNNPLFPYFHYFLLMFHYCSCLISVLVSLQNYSSLFVCSLPLKVTYAIKQLLKMCYLRQGSRIFLFCRRVIYVLLPRYSSF